MLGVGENKSKELEFSKNEKAHFRPYYTLRLYQKQIVPRMLTRDLQEKFQFSINT